MVDVLVDTCVFSVSGAGVVNLCGQVELGLRVTIEPLPKRLLLSPDCPASLSDAPRRVQ